MAQPNVDGVLITWGDRLFYPRNRVVKADAAPRLSARVVRQRIEATVVRRAPQVMVKVTGGGRGMRAIAAHFRYISKNGRLGIEDQRGEILRGKDALHDLAEEWRLGGSLIPSAVDPEHRREAFNIMLSMPRGTDPLAVQRAAREFAGAELADHKYVMVLHDHQANPHVHISVRAESNSGRRLNPRKTDLHRWRETFAEKLRGHGIDAEATRQGTRGRFKSYEPLWRIKAREDGRRLRTTFRDVKAGEGVEVTKARAIEGWARIGQALAQSGDVHDRQLAASVLRFVGEMSASGRSARGDRALDRPATPQSSQDRGR